MSTRVSPKLTVSPSHELKKHGILFDVIRIIASVTFAHGATWTWADDAFVDTGAWISIIPHDIWQYMDFKIIQDCLNVAIGGEYTKADFCEVTMRVLDATMVSPSMIIRAYLCASDRIPLILGIGDILTNCNFFCSYRSHSAYLEFP